jgi:Icc-related predicted phosphoesterase
MRLLAFSDLHRDLDRAADLVLRSEEADVVIGAGDFASVHNGLEETIDALKGIQKPTILVPGNNETEDALRSAVSGWESAIVLHGEGTTIDHVEFFGLGAGIPKTPWDWSFDVEDDDVPGLLHECPEGAVLVLHSPPRGHCDQSSSGDHLGSPALAEAIEEHQPRLAVCGHIHEAWGSESTIGKTAIRNLGPQGTFLEV